LPRPLRASRANPEYGSNALRTSSASYPPSASSFFSSSPPPTFTSAVSTKCLIAASHSSIAELKGYLSKRTDGFV